MIQWLNTNNAWTLEAGEMSDTARWPVRRSEGGAQVTIKSSAGEQVCDQQLPATVTSHQQVIELDNLYMFKSGHETQDFRRKHFSDCTSFDR